MKYKEFIPSKKLSDYIQFIWILESETPEEKFEREIILPDGIVELVFLYRNPFFTYNSEDNKLNFITREIENNPGGWAARLIIEKILDTEFIEYFDITMDGKNFSPFLKNHWQKVDWKISFSLNPHLLTLF